MGGYSTSLHAQRLYGQPHLGVRCADGCGRYGGPIAARRGGNGGGRRQRPARVRPAYRQRRRALAGSVRIRRAQRASVRPDRRFFCGHGHDASKGLRCPAAAKPPGRRIGAPSGRVLPRRPTRLGCPHTRARLRRATRDLRWPSESSVFFAASDKTHRAGRCLDQPPMNSHNFATTLNPLKEGLGLWSCIAVMVFVVVMVICFWFIVPLARNAVIPLPPPRK